MSTIASPREPSTPLRRMAGTPTSSGRPSLDINRSAVASPIHLGSSQFPPPASSSSAVPVGASSSSAASSLSLPSSSSAAAAAAATTTAKRSNRVALREYYNLRAAAALPPRIEIPDSEVPSGELDAPDFKPDEYVAKITAESTLQELLRLYARVLGEVRALDAEKKALVYDNYSKLIDATETIRKMRANMDPLNPMASTLDLAITQIYTQASSIRDALRETVPPPDSADGMKRDEAERRQRTRKLAIKVLGTPERLRALVKDGKMTEARRQWEMPRRLLEAWRDRGLGGDDVQACIDEGDAVVGRIPSASAAQRRSRDER